MKTNGLQKTKIKNKLSQIRFKFTSKEYKNIKRLSGL